MEGSLSSDGNTTRAEHRFHVVMACVFLLIGMAGFARSYWLKLPGGQFAGVPILHVHGLLMTAWLGFYLAQTLLAASGRMSRHRAWGLAGIALFCLLICSTLALTFRSIHVALARSGGQEASLQMPTATLISIALATAFFAAAIACTGRPATHKRLMVLLMAVLLQAAVARLVVLPLLGGGGPPQVWTTLPTGLVTDVLIVAAIAWDWRLRGRPHRAYVIGGLAILAVQLLTAPVAASRAGIAVTAAFGRLMG